MTSEYPAVSPSNSDNEDPLPGFLRRLGLDGGLMAANDLTGDDEAGDEQMGDDWAGALAGAEKAQVTRSQKSQKSSWSTGTRTPLLRMTAACLAP